MKRGIEKTGYFEGLKVVKREKYFIIFFIICIWGSLLDDVHVELVKIMNAMTIKSCCMVFLPYKIRKCKQCNAYKFQDNIQILYQMRKHTFWKNSIEVLLQFIPM